MCQSLVILMLRNKSQTDMAKKDNNYLVSVTKDGKVVDLQFSKDLINMHAIRLKHTVEKGTEGCIFEALHLPSSDNKEKEDTEPQVQKFSRNGNPPNRVKCVETGFVYESVAVCSRAMSIPEKSIRESIRRGVVAYGYRFVLLPPLQKF